MRRLLLLSTLTLALLATAAPAGAASGSGSPSCLRGNWVANQAETRRVLAALVPGGMFTSFGQLYMTFNDGAFQYGSTRMIFQSAVGDATLIARARFFSLAPYTARTGLLTTQSGSSTIEYGRMTGSKGGRTFSVAGPPTKTTRIPGGSTPFQCRGATLKVRLPRFASADWITLHRGTP